MLCLGCPHNLVSTDNFQAPLDLSLIIHKYSVYSFESVPLDICKLSWGMLDMSNDFYQLCEKSVDERGTQVYVI